MLDKSITTPYSVLGSRSIPSPEAVNLSVSDDQLAGFARVPKAVPKAVPLTLHICTVSVGPVLLGFTCRPTEVSLYPSTLLPVLNFCM